MTMEANCLSSHRGKYIQLKTWDHLKKDIVLENFNENGFYKYYNETTNMEYLYDPTTKLCFSFLADDGDESMLEVYGLSTWVSNLTEKRISMATLANLYTIIGL